MGSFDDLIPGGSSQGGSGAFDDLIPKKSSLARRVLGDTGVSLLKGAVAVPEAAVGLGNIVSGGLAGKYAEQAGFRPKEAKAALDEMYSPEQKAANQYVQEGDGFLDTIKRGIERPSVIGQSVAESLPLLLPGAAAARGIGAATKVAPYIAGAAGEGLVGAGSAAEQLRQGSEDGTISGKQTLGALASGVGTFGFGAAGGKLASSAIGKKLGISDIDTVLAGGASNPASVGLAKRALSGAVSEGVLEELPQSMWEQAAQNYATDKPLGEGVGQAGAMGLLAGTAMGGTFNAMQRGEQRKAVDDANPAVEETPAAAPLGLTYNANVRNGEDPLYTFPDGSTMSRAEYEQDRANKEQGRLDSMIQPADPEPKLQETGPMSSAVNVGVDSGATSLRPQGSFSDMSEFANLLGQEQQDVQSRRTGIAHRQALQREVALQDADQRVADQMAKEAAQRRRAVLDQVLSDPTTQNPADRFAAELQRQGFRDSTPTADELATVQRFNDIKAAEPAGPEIEPSLPNELDAEQLGIKPKQSAKSGSAPQARDKVAEVRQLVADGWKISNKTLVSPTGKKRILNTAEHAAAKEATRERNLAAMERYRQSKGKGTPVSTTNVVSEETDAPEIEQLAPQAPQANDAQVESQPSAASSIKRLQAELKSAKFGERTELNGQLIDLVSKDAEDSVASGSMPVYSTGNGTFVAIHPSAQKVGMVQATRYSDSGVFGDSQYKTIREAVRDNGLWFKPRMDDHEATQAIGNSIAAEAEYRGRKSESKQVAPAPAVAQSDVEDYGKRVVRRNKPVSKWTAEEIQDRLARADSGESPISDESRSQLQAALEPLVAANKGKEAKAAEQAERVKKMQAAKAANKDTFQIGENKDSLDRVSVRDGVVHLGDYPATDYNSGDEITVPDGATKQQVLDALIAGEAVTKKAKVWGKNGPEQSVADRIAELQAERDAMTKSEQRAAEAIQSAMEVAAGEGVAEAEVMAELGVKNEEVGQTERSNQESQVGNDVGSEKPARSGDEERDGDAQGQEREVAADGRVSSEAKPETKQELAKSVKEQSEAIEPVQPSVQIDTITASDKARAIGQENRIADFGDKIGGARKDKSQPLGPRNSTKEADERPAWIRKYHVMQVMESRFVNAADVGKWQIMQDTGARGSVSPVSSKKFATEQEANDALPFVVVSKRHRVYSYKDRAGNPLFGIFRNITERKRGMVKGGFASHDEAMKYLAAHPVEVIEHKFDYPERPWLDKIERIGTNRISGDVTTKMFQDTFGFRAGEFGNWNMGGDGQAALNHAYESLLDLADAIGVPPKAISLDGQLAIAFGARGTGGKRSAAAHYEPGSVVINLTKINGAGSLAHEWWHAVDHYFAKNGGRKDSDSVVAGGFSYKSESRPELIEAIKAVVDSMMYSESSQTTDAEIIKSRAKKRMDEAVNTIDYHNRDLRGWLTNGEYNRGKKTATKEQLAQWDAMVDRLKNGDMGDKVYIENPSKMRGAMGFETGSVLRDMNAIYKSVTGRGFLKQDQQSTGRKLHWVVDSIADNKSKLSVKEDETKTVKGRSSYYIESRHIDSEHTNDYWSSPEEMGARAFESYIYDKLVSQGGRSDYLVYGVENRYYSAMDIYPYPEGLERENIDKAFDALFSTIQTKETDKGIALFEDKASYTSSKEAVKNEYGKDLLGNVVSEPEESRPDSIGRDTAAENRDILAASIVQGAKFATVAGPRKTGEVKSAIDRVSGAADAAHVLAGMRKNTQENFNVLVLDENRKPISVLRLFAGSTSQASVFPEIVAKAVYETPGAARIWYAHNHPSGTAVASSADERLTKELSKAFGTGTGVTVEGHVIIAGTKAVELDSEGYPIGGKFDIPAGARTKSIQVTERTFHKTGSLGAQISSPDAARKEVARISEGKTGVVFLNAQNIPVAFLPMQSADMSILRNGRSAKELFGAAARSNASAAILNFSTDVDKQAAIAATRNIYDALSGGGRGISVLDAFLNGESFSEKGYVTGNDNYIPGTFFSRDDVNASRGQGSGMAFRDLQAVVDRVSKGFNNLPKIHVLDSPQDLSDRRDNERTLKEQIEQAGAMDDVEGAHHNGEIYLFSSGIASEERAEHVLATHEITHYGLRGTMGKGLDSALQNIWLYNKEIRAKATVLRIQLGLTSNVSAVEEVLAEMKDSDLVKLKGWRKMVQAFRDWAHKAGFDRIAEKLDGLITKGMSDQEKADLFVANMVNAARDWVRNGKPARGYDPGTSMLGDANFSAKKSDVTDTTAFRKWFGKSKVVDADGKPLVVYHSTSKAFNAFDSDKTMDGVFWFSSNKKKLESGEAGAASRGDIMPVYLSAKKLAGLEEYDRYSVDELIGQGYDGIKLDDDYVIFEPTQIKSAIGNNGNFDASNPDIRFSRNKSASVDASITEIFDGLAGRGLKKVRAEERLAEHPQAESIRYVQDNILDILEELEGAGTIKINC